MINAILIIMAAFSLIMFLFFPAYYQIKPASGIMIILDETKQELLYLQANMIKHMISTARDHITNSQIASNAEEAKFEGLMADHILVGLIRGFERTDGMPSAPRFIDAIPMLESARVALESDKHPEATSILHNVSLFTSNIVSDVPD